MLCYRSRNKDTPRLSSTHKDIQLNGKWAQILADERFLIIDDGNAEKILTFSTTRNLSNVVSADIIFLRWNFLHITEPVDPIVYFICYS